MNYFEHKQTRTIFSKHPPEEDITMVFFRGEWKLLRGHVLLSPLKIQFFNQETTLNGCLLGDIESEVKIYQKNEFLRKNFED